MSKIIRKASKYTFICEYCKKDDESEEEEEKNTSENEMFGGKFVQSHWNKKT